MSRIQGIERIKFGLLEVLEGQVAHGKYCMYGGSQTVAQDGICSFM